MKVVLFKIQTVAFSKRTTKHAGVCVKGKKHTAFLCKEMNGREFTFFMSVLCKPLPFARLLSHSPVCRSFQESEVP